MRAGAWQFHARHFYAWHFYAWHLHHLCPKAHGGEKKEGNVKDTHVRCLKIRLQTSSTATIRHSGPDPESRLPTKQVGSRWTCI